MDVFSIGETVIVESRYGIRTAEVKKVTPTGIIKVIYDNKGEGVFNSSGRERGADGFGASYIKKLTQAYKDKLQRIGLLSDIDNIKFNKLTNKQLVKIIEVANG